MSEYTYYNFWDDLCPEDDPDCYRVGPNGFEFQMVWDDQREWHPSGFADIQDLMDNAVGEARYEEVSVD